MHPLKVLGGNAINALQKDFNQEWCLGRQGLTSPLAIQQVDKKDIMPAMYLTTGLRELMNVSCRDHSKPAHLMIQQSDPL